MILRLECPRCHKDSLVTAAEPFRPCPYCGIMFSGKYGLDKGKDKRIIKESPPVFSHNGRELPQRPDKKDEYKTKKQLIDELVELRQRTSALEASQAKCKVTEKVLQESEEKYRSLVESTEDSIYLVDRNYKYLFMNKKHISRTGFSDHNYLDHAYGEFHSPDETKWFIEKVDEVFNTGKSIQHEHKSLRDNRYYLLTSSPVKKSDGTITAVTIVSKDINELKSMEEQLRTLSLSDELTGIYNRRGFFTLGEQQLKLAKRMKKGIFMLYADVDDLKEINDTWGHKEGDLALIETAAVLKKTFRGSDVVARVGGDEFTVIPIGISGDNIEVIAARLQKSIEVHNTEKSCDYNLSLSFGIAYYDPENPCSVEELLAQADKLMYEQKRQRHNLVSNYC